MSCEPLPELLPYLEGILDESLERFGMTMLNKKVREKVLCQLYKELEAFIFLRIQDALPPTESLQFAWLLEQRAPEEELQAFTMRHIANIPALVQQIFLEFRAQHVNPGQKLKP
jgi:hypothetical protein